MGQLWVRAFAKPKQSSWHQRHEVQWWSGLVDIVTWEWGVLACSAIISGHTIQELKRRKRGREGGGRVGKKVEMKMLQIHSMCQLKIEPKMMAKVTATDLKM